LAICNASNAKSSASRWRTHYYALVSLISISASSLVGREGSSSHPTKEMMFCASLDWLAQVVILWLDYVAASFAMRARLNLR
jgi:hypothetical protein